MGRIPSHVQVGPFSYEVRVDPKETAERRYLSGKSYTCATTYLRELRIIVDPVAPVDRQRVYLFHEVMHACWELVDLDEKELEDETVAQRLAPALVDVLRRNPALVAYLTEASDDES